MLAKPFRLIVATLALVTLAIVGGLLTACAFDRPKPTAFGWPASMTTLAGDGVRGSTDGPGSKARFSDPFGVAIGPKGELYVADAGETNRIRRIARDGRTTTLPGRLDTPSGLAVDAAGNLYVADTGANVIRKLDRKGRLTTLAGDGVAGVRDGPARQARFNGPVAVAVGPRGEVYVADTYNDRIRLISTDGRVSTLAGGAAPGFADGQGEAAAFDTPCGLTFDGTGALLIADTGNNAIRRVDQNGVVTTLAHATQNDPQALLRGPIGLAATPDGFLYIASVRRGRILQMAPGGEIRILTGPDAPDPENRALRLTRPSGLAVDHHGDLYVAEAGGYTVRKLSARRPSAARQPQPVITAAALPPLTRAPVTPWPLAPQLGWHEVVGNMGEVRGNYHGESRDHLHAGLDVRANVGTPVLAIADEKVQSPLPNWNVDGASEGLQIDQVTYIHMRVGRTPGGAPLDPARIQLVRDGSGNLLAVRVKRGTRFRVGDPLGTVNAMAHVHLELGSRGGDVNPMALHFPGLTDHVAPHIAAIQIVDAAGRPLTEQVQGRLVVPRAAGPLGIIVDAWDHVDGNAERRRLGLYRAGFQILDGAGAPAKGYGQPRITLEFDRMPTASDAPKIAYAPASGDTAHSAQATSFLYVVTNRVRGGRAEAGAWNPAELPPGDYTLRIYAADYAGNLATEGRDLPLVLR